MVEKRLNIGRIDKALTELEKEQQQRAENSKRKAQNIERSAAKKAGIGKNKFVEPDINVPLPQRFAQNKGSLRLVASTADASKQMLSSLKRRGLVEVEGKSKVNLNTRTFYNVK